MCDARAWSRRRFDSRETGREWVEGEERESEIRSHEAVTHGTKLLDLIWRIYSHTLHTPHSLLQLLLLLLHVLPILSDRGITHIHILPLASAHLKIPACLFFFSSSSSSSSLYSLPFESILCSLLLSSPSHMHCSCLLLLPPHVFSHCVSCVREKKERERRERVYGMVWWVYGTVYVRHMRLWWT